MSKIKNKKKREGRKTGSDVREGRKERKELEGRRERKREGKKEIKGREGKEMKGNYRK